MASWVDPEQVKRSRAFVSKVGKEHQAPWLKGEVRRHCIRCEAEVGREDRSCPSCRTHLRKECPECHYWVEIDVTFCVRCRHAFPLPPPSKATIKMWHAIEAERTEGLTATAQRIIGSASTKANASDGEV